MVLFPGASVFELFNLLKGNFTEEATAANTEKMPIFQINFLREGKFPVGVLLLSIIINRLLNVKLSIIIFVIDDMNSINKMISITKSTRFICKKRPELVRPFLNFSYYFFSVRIKTTKFQISSVSGIFFLKLGISSLPSAIL